MTPGAERICPRCGGSKVTADGRCATDGALLIPAAAVTLPPASASTYPVETDPWVGRAVGAYVIARRLGEGAMGVVFEAVHPLIGKRVAIKILNDATLSSTRSGEWALEEARSVNRVAHRGVVDVFDVGSLSDGRPFLVMELLQGESLDVFMTRRGKLPQLEVVEILLELLEALNAAHAAGVVHRDLKPGNIMRVTPTGGEPYFKLLDFGLARMIRDRKVLTKVSTVMGTPAYMAPEQAQSGEMGPPSDLYAVGVMAYEMLSGATPFSDKTALATMLAHARKAAPRIRQFEKDVLPELDELIYRLMAKDPAARPNGDELRESLTKLSQKLRAPPEKPAGWLPALAVLAVLSGGAAGAVLSAREGLWALPGPAASWMQGQGPLLPVAAAVVPVAVVPPPVVAPSPPPPPPSVVDAGPVQVPDAGSPPAAVPDVVVVVKAPPKKRTGELEVRLKGGQGELFIDGEPHGRSPWDSPIPLRPGDYQLEIRFAKGTPSSWRRVQIEAGKTTDVVIPAPAP